MEVIELLGNHDWKKIMPATKGKKLQPVICPLCNTDCGKRLTKFEAHLQDTHDLTSQQLWDQRNNGPVLCACGCKKSAKWLGWKKGYGQLLRGHNANLEAVYGKSRAKEIGEKRAAALRGQPGWAKGLTKETDPRIRQRAEATARGRKAAFDAGKIKAWNKGLTKETDPRVDAASTALTQGYADGRYVPWAKGLTKETDPRIATMAQRVSHTHSANNLRQRLDELKRLGKQEIIDRIETNSELKIIAGLDAYVSDATPCITVECIRCNDRFTGSLRKLQHGRCYTCDPGGSKGQIQISDWLTHLEIEIIKNDRSTIQGDLRAAELDILIPSHDLAIEYNGLYWHSDLHKTKTYHQNKTQACGEVGISLFHIFEDEWLNKRSIIEGMLKHRLGLSTTVGARECKVVEVPFLERRDFLDANHIDGDVKATVALGLRHPTLGLLMVMSLRRPFHRKYKDTLEVARVSGKQGYGVIGGLSRLTSHCSRWASGNGGRGLISYVDQRHGGDRQGWRGSGWTEVSETSPRFWWTDFRERFNRFKYKADRTQGLSEAQVAQNADVFKIWGCRNTLFELAT